MKRCIVIAFVYTQIALFTGFYRYHHVADNRVFRELGDTYAGLLWPVYWNARLVEWVVTS